jgi:hypothetical protein
MNNIIKILLALCFSIAAAGATSLNEQISSGADDQVISVDDYQVISNQGVSQNLTLSGKGNESVLDFSKMVHFWKIGSPSDHKRLLLRNLVIKDCLRVHSYADVVAENCKFENASLYLRDASLYAKDCTFTGCRVKTCSDDGGALNLYRSSALLDHCSFVGNNAFVNSSNGPNCFGGGSADGGSGGAIFMNLSSAVLLDSVLDGNTASTGGAICLVDSDLVARGGSIINNRALPINYTNPVVFFSGEGGAISAYRTSKVMLIDTLVSGNLALKSPDFYAEESSEVKLVGAKVSENREI